MIVACENKGVGQDGCPARTARTASKTVWIAERDDTGRPLDDDLDSCLLSCFGMTGKMAEMSVWSRIVARTAE